MSFLPYDDRHASVWTSSLGLSAIAHAGLGFLLLSSSIPFMPQMAAIPEAEEEFTIVSIDVLKPVQVLEPEAFSELEQALDDPAMLSPTSDDSLLPEDTVADIQEDLVEQDAPEAIEVELEEIVATEEPEALPAGIAPEAFDDVAVLQELQPLGPDLTANDIQEIVADTVEVEPETVTAFDVDEPDEVAVATVESLLATKSEVLTVPEEIAPQEIALAVPLAEPDLVVPDNIEQAPLEITPEVLVPLPAAVPQDFQVIEDDFALTEDTPLDEFSTSGGFGEALAPSAVFDDNVITLAPDPISDVAIVDLVPDPVPAVQPVADLVPDPVVADAEVVDLVPDAISSEEVAVVEQILDADPETEVEPSEVETLAPETVTEDVQEQLALLAPELTDPTRPPLSAPDIQTPVAEPDQTDPPKTEPKRPVIANPSPQLQGLGQLIRQIRAVPQPQCSLLLPRRSGDAGLGVSMVGADDVALNAAADRVISRVDVEVVRSLDIVDQRQCAVLDALRQSTSYPASRIGLALENTSLKSGESLKARVLGAGGLNVALLLVDDNGVVQDLTRFATLDGDVVVIDAPVARSGVARTTLQMLVVLGGEAGGFPLADQMGKLAQDVFQSLPGEVLQAAVFGMATFQVE